jgi:hypothetical protein
MEAAYAAMDDSPASTSDSTPDAPASTPDPTPVADDPAASLPSDTGAAPVADTRGPIPYDRHEAVLRKAREEYAWLNEHGDPTTVQQKLSVLRMAEQDPARFMRTFAASVGIDPSQVFQQAAPQAPAPAPEPPQPDVLLENGQMVYSHERMQQLLAFERQQSLQQVNQQIAPLVQRAAVSEMQERATVTAKQELAAAASWPGFADHKQELAAFLAANPRATLRDAYIHVVPAKLAAQASQASEEGYRKALTEYQIKAGAASTPTPRMAGTPPTGRPTTIREALEQALDG